MSTPESDRIKRKAALKTARKKLALRKKQREELRTQRAARLGGHIDPIISTSSSSNIKPLPLMRRTSSLNKRTSLKKQTSLLSFIDFDDDKKEDSSLLPPSTAPNKASILRAPRATSSLTISRLKNYNFTPVNEIETRDKETQTNFDMFSQYLIEEYDEEFADGKASLTDEVAANLILSKYKIGWPKELWMHEKSLSPSPQNIMYGDDEEFIQQEKKIKLLKKQEKERKERQLLLIQRRRKERIARKNRKILPENEFDLLLHSGDFLDNFRKKTKWMERSLGINNRHCNIDFVDVDVTAGKDNDVVYDEVVDEDDDKYNEYEEENNSNKQKLKVKMNKKKNNLLKYISKFATEETNGRAIGDINFCASNTDWFLASYFRESVGESTFYNDGFVLVWNLILGRLPEYKLYSESMITSTHFHPMDKFLIYASTTSGQILCYDLRNGSASKPVQRTALSDGHSSAIFSMDFLQSAGSGHGDRDRKRHLLSISNDGKLCIFKDDTLHEKAMHSGVLQVNDATHYYTSTQTNTTINKENISGSSFSQELSTTCFAYQHKHSDNLIFGSDSGKLYRTDIHNSKGDNDIIAVEQCIDAHFGPITNIDFPKYGGTRGIKKISSSISGLYLTSSYDWSVKLWHADYLQSIETYTRQNDYVYDVKWCTGGKPGVFVCCDGDRKLNLFDLKYDFKQPINIINVPTDNNSDAVTKLNWGNNGKYLCCGDSNGNIYLYLTNQSLLYPQQNDFDNFDKAITSTIKTRQLTKQKGK